MALEEFLILRASSEHAEEACQVLISSIKKICIPDHNNDPQKLQEWLNNKTSDNIKKWIQDTNNYSLVAVDKSRKVVGISMINKNGEILLNYLLPEFLFKGIGKQMLKEMESFAKRSGIKIIKAISTITASHFYERNGFSRNHQNQQTNENYSGILLIKFLE